MRLLASGPCAAPGGPPANAGGPYPVTAVVESVERGLAASRARRNPFKISTTIVNEWLSAFWGCRIEDFMPAYDLPRKKATFNVRLEKGSTVMRDFSYCILDGTPMVGGACVRMIRAWDPTTPVALAVAVTAMFCTVGKRPSQSIPEIAAFMVASLSPRER